MSPFRLPCVIMILSSPRRLVCPSSPPPSHQHERFPLLDPTVAFKSFADFPSFLVNGITPPIEYEMTSPIAFVPPDLFLLLTGKVLLPRSLIFLSKTSLICGPNDLGCYLSPHFRGRPHMFFFLFPVFSPPSRIRNSMFATALVPLF